MSKLYLVIGFGVTGFSVIRFLHKNKCKVIAIDTRKNPPNLAAIKKSYSDINIFYGKELNEYEDIIFKADIIVLSPGIALSNQTIQRALSKQIEVIGDIELFARFNKNKDVVFITGSNGKSTVTALLGKMAKSSGINVGVGGNIGKPALDLLSSTQNYELYILELSSFQLETTKSLFAQCALLLNITPDHLDRYKNFNHYKESKLLTYSLASHVIYNNNDVNTYPPLSQFLCSSSQPTLNITLQPNFDLLSQPGVDTSSRICSDTSSRICSDTSLRACKAKQSIFAYDEPNKNCEFGIKTNTNNNTLAIYQGKNKLLNIDELIIVGKHNIENVLAALTAAKSINLPIEPCLQAIKEFKSLEHRCEVIGKFKDVLWINDSKGTNVGATISAITGLQDQIKGKWIIILGGDNRKGANLSDLLEHVQNKCSALIVYGHAKEELKDIFKGKIEIHTALNFDDIIYIADKITNCNDGVLFSPACASFDMFSNYEERGNIFKSKVIEYMSNLGN